MWRSGLTFQSKVLRLSISTCALIALPAFHSQSQPAVKKDTAKLAHPYMVSIIPANTRRGAEFDKHGCGGTLIGPTAVLTAAHCLENDPDGEGHGKGTNDAKPVAAGACFKTRDFDVYTGSANFKNGERVKVVEACRHESYQPLRNRDDIAVLRLERAPKAAVHGVIEVATEEQDATFAKNGSDALLLGWGDRGGKVAQRALGTVKQKIVTHAACNTALIESRRQMMVGELDKFMPEHLKYLGLPFDDDKATAAIYADMTNTVFERAGTQVTSDMICSSDAAGKSSHCNGDSGGPLIVKSETGKSIQVGVVSWGESCIHETMPPGVYMRVAKYRDWISKHIK